MFAGLQHRLVVLHGQVFAFLALEQLVDVGDHGRDFADDENIGAEIEDFLCNVSIDAIDERHYGDHRGHADDNSEQR